MTDRELLEQWLRPCAVVPVTMEATRILVEALRARLSQCDRCGEVNPAEIHTCTPRAFTNVDDLIADLEKPDPVGWIYEDDEGRMMFTQVPQNSPFWEPVYKAKKK